jgi:uncharacterized membrane-anchored protein
MKLAPLRRRNDALPGVSGVARLDRRTPRLAGRLNPGDIAIIDHVDLDRTSAEALLAAKPAAIINAQPCISGRYPNLGPQLIVSHGILLLDNVGAEIFGSVKEGTKVRIDGHTVFLGDTPVVTGTLQDIETVEALMLEAKAGLSSQLEAFAVNTAEFMGAERSLLLDGIGIPEVKTSMTGRHVLIVVRSHEHAADLKSLKHYIREYKPVLVGVDGGADALLEDGHTPDIIIGDFDSVSEKGLACGAELVHHVHPDGRAPGRENLLEWGVDYLEFVAEGTSEDVAMLLAYESKAQLIVAVGTHATMVEFLDKGRPGMASTFLTRLRLGPMLVDAKGVSRLYEGRVRRLDIFLLVGAALVAMLVVGIVADPIHVFIRGLWVTLKDAFSG